MSGYYKIEKSTRIKDREKAQVFSLCFDKPGITRKQIIATLKLRPTGVSNIVNQLCEQGLLTDGDSINDGKKGRPEVPLFLNPGRFLVIAIYVVSMQVHGVLVDLDRQIVGEENRKVQASLNNEELERIIVSIVDSLITKKHAMDAEGKGEILGIGCALQGLVNTKTKTLILSSRWPLVRNFSFLGLEKRYSLEFSIYPTLEAQFIDSLLSNPSYAKGGTLLYHWGYGVGSRFAYDGKILTSDIGPISEIGHTVFDPASTEKCFCGRTGCIETECAIWALFKRNLFGDMEPIFDENEFQDFIAEYGDAYKDRLKRPIEAAAQGLSTLFSIFYPNCIILESPFLSNDFIMNSFMTNFEKRIAMGKQYRPFIEFVGYGYRGEIFGCTYSLFQKRLERELLAK